MKKGKPSICTVRKLTKAELRIIGLDAGVYVRTWLDGKVSFTGHKIPVNLKYTKRELALAMEKLERYWNGEIKYLGGEIVHE